MKAGSGAGAETNSFGSTTLEIIGPSQVGFGPFLPNPNPELSSPILDPGPILIHYITSVTLIFNHPWVKTYSFLVKKNYKGTRYGSSWRFKNNVQAEVQLIR